MGRAGLMFKAQGTGTAQVVVWAGPLGLDFLLIFYFLIFLIYLYDMLKIVIIILNLN